MNTPVDDTWKPPCRHTEYTGGCMYCDQWGRMTQAERRGMEAYYMKTRPELYRPRTQEAMTAVLSRINEAPKSSWVPLGRADVWAKLLQAQQADPPPQGAEPKTVTISSRMQKLKTERRPGGCGCRGKGK